MQNSRSLPLFQMFSPIIVPRLTPATSASRPETMPPLSSLSITRSAARPMITPTRNTTMPAVSGGMKARNRDHTRDRPTSTRPANMVMPQTNGSPPSFTASTEGAR
jgi:hypothetical protein